jgi:Tetracyclin repressor-like, C-terminal domain
LKYGKCHVSGASTTPSREMNPARYGLMFGNAIPGHQPSQTAQSAARASFDALEAIVRECVDAGVLAPRTDPTFVAEILIAAAHGAVSLELAGHFDDADRADDRFAVLTSAALRPFLAGASD